MKHDDSIQGVLIQSVLRHCGVGAMLRLCRTAVALIAIITRLRPTDFVGRAIILSACSLPAIFLAGLPAVFLAGCRKEAPPQPYVRTIDLEALDASCTEAWLRITAIQLLATVRLLHDGQAVSDLRFLTSATLASSGVYFTRLSTPLGTQVKKAILMR